MRRQGLSFGQRVEGIYAQRISMRYSASRKDSPSHPGLPNQYLRRALRKKKGHDVNISFQDAENIVGRELAATLRDTSLRIYLKAAEDGGTKRYHYRRYKI